MCHKEKILLFIPAFNCKDQLVRVVDKIEPEICEYLSEIIIVDNDSNDGTVDEICQKLKHMELPVRIRVLKNKINYGYGGSNKIAFLYGLKYGFDYVIVLHGDDQGDIRDLIPLLRNGDYKKQDAVLGARFMKESVLPGYSWFRTVGNHVFNAVFSIALGKRIYDLGSGLNVYSVESLKKIPFIRFRDDMNFLCKLMMCYMISGKKVMFYPITWREEDQVSNARLFGQSVLLMKMICDCVMDRKQFFLRDYRQVKIKYSYSVLYDSMYQFTDIDIS